MCTPSSIVLHTLRLLACAAQHFGEKKKQMWPFVLFSYTHISLKGNIHFQPTAFLEVAF